MNTRTLGDLVREQLAKNQDTLTITEEQLDKIETILIQGKLCRDNHSRTLDGERYRRELDEAYAAESAFLEIMEAIREGREIKYGG